MAKESLVVHVQKLLFKKYTKNHKFIYIFIYFLLSRGEENNRKRAYTSTRLNKLKKKITYWGLHYFYNIHD